MHCYLKTDNSYKTLSIIMLVLLGTVILNAHVLEVGALVSL